MRRLSLMLSAGLLLTACSSPQTAAPVTADYPAPSLPVKEVVLDDLKSPWSLAFLSADEVLISEKEGDLVRANLKTKAKTVITGFPDDLVVDKRGNNGRFDVILDPDFDANNLIYMAYASNKDEQLTTKIIRGKLVGDALEAVETLFIAEPYTVNTERYHYGGGMLFGPDGKLYFTVGERLFSEVDQPEIPIAQNVGDRRGKIYRLNPDGSIPADNPDFGEGAVPGLWAIGIRAAQGLALNPASGEIWFSEHGTHQGDELNRLEKGANYGWPVKTTGKYRYADYKPPVDETADYRDPDWHWRHTVAPTGLTFYTGDEFPLWKGDIIVPGLSRGSLWRMDLEDGEFVQTDALFTNDRARTRKAAISPDGKLYILTDTRFSIPPGGRFTDSGTPSGQLIRIRNAAQTL